VSATSLRISGAWKELSSGKVRVGNAWKTVTQGKIYVGGAWKDLLGFTPALSLSASPSTAIGSATYGFGPAVTNSVTVTPTGGLAPYTYSWARVSGTIGSAGSPTAATTVFGGDPNPDYVASSTFRCTCTDSLGNTATADVGATFTLTPWWL